jgi:lysophospholipase L1-like esterase
MAALFRSALGVAAVVGGLLLAACSGSPAPAASDPKSAPKAVPKTTAAAALPQGPYVALGDSYTSGPGIPDQVGTPVGCDRSSRDYPALVAQSLKLDMDEVRDVSCSGATTADLSAPQSTKDGTNPAQFDALDADTAIVTLGIGGNDVDFAGVLGRCVETDLVPALMDSSSQLAPCKAYYTSGGVNQIQRNITAAAGKLSGALAEIGRRAPHARVFVVGYPALVPADGATCGHTLGITAGDVVFLHDEETQLNSMLRQRAEAAGAVYVDTYTPSVGHDACADSTDRWIEPLMPTAPAFPLHPNARGEQGMADAVVAAVKAADAVA